jgi:hypothetical protein
MLYSKKSIQHLNMVVKAAQSLDLVYRSGLLSAFVSLVQYRSLVPAPHFGSGCVYLCDCHPSPGLNNKFIYLNCACTNKTISNTHWLEQTCWEPKYLARVREGLGSPVIRRLSVLVSTDPWMSCVLCPFQLCFLLRPGTILPVTTPSQHFLLSCCNHVLTCSTRCICMLFLKSVPLVPQVFEPCLQTFNVSIHGLYLKLRHFFHIVLMSHILPVLSQPQHVVP